MVAGILPSVEGDGSVAQPPDLGIVWLDGDKDIGISAEGDEYHCRAAVFLAVLSVVAQANVEAEDDTRIAAIWVDGGFGRAEGITERADGIGCVEFQHVSLLCNLR